MKSIYNIQMYIQYEMYIQCIYIVKCIYFMKCIYIVKCIYFMKCIYIVKCIYNLYIYSPYLREFFNKIGGGISATNALFNGFFSILHNGLFIKQ